jgi:penicillin-insensitive murein endopeptidase
MNRLRRFGLACIVLLALTGAVLGVRASLAEVANPAQIGSGRSVTLPYSGKNFQAYSWFWHAVGRCYLKDTLGAAVLDAYKEMEIAIPDRRFIYGEIGWKNGGNFWPHRTHRQGLSVDFMTPVLRHKAEGTYVPDTLSCMPWNLWGYGTRLEAAKNGDPEIDAEACIAHLVALNKAVATYGLSIKLVIFDPPLLKILRASPNFRKIAGLPFMEKAAWFPHDGHYHVDFATR